VVGIYYSFRIVPISLSLSILLHLAAARRLRSSNETIFLFNTTRLSIAAKALRNPPRGGGGKKLASSAKFNALMVGIGSEKSERKRQNARATKNGRGINLRFVISGKTVQSQRRFLDTRRKKSTERSRIERITANPNDLITSG